MGFLILIYMGTWHVKMDVIFHSRAQEEMTFYQVWGSPVVQLLWVLPADNLICSSEGLHSLFPWQDWSKGARTWECLRIAKLKTLHMWRRQWECEVLKWDSKSRAEMAGQGDSAALRRTQIGRAEHNLTLEGKIIQSGSEYETSGLHLFHCQFSRSANLKVLSVDTSGNSFVQIILHFILRA